MVKFEFKAGKTPKSVLLNSTEAETGMGVALPRVGSQAIPETSKPLSSMCAFASLCDCFVGCFKKEKVTSAFSLCGYGGGSLCLPSFCSTGSWPTLGFFVLSPHPRISLGKLMRLGHFCLVVVRCFFFFFFPENLTLGGKSLPPPIFFLLLQYWASWQVLQFQCPTNHIWEEL